MIIFMKNPLNLYNISHNDFATAKTAAEILQQYIGKLCGEKEKKGSTEFSIRVLQNVDDEYFCIRSIGNNLEITGGKRGVIYGVYEFLERYCDCRFFAHDSEYIPSKLKEKKIDADIFVEENSVIKFREVLGNSSGNKAESFLKFRFNSNAWGEKLKEEHGGGYSYAGIPAHSLTGEFLLKDYVESNPELFAFDGEKRLTDRMGQVCFSADGLTDIIVKEVEKCLKKRPTATFVSLTQGDNNNFCQCVQCKELYKSNSITDCFLNLVNNVAKRIKGQYPRVFIHTFAYNKTTAPSSHIQLADNVIVQYCVGSCKNHAIYDESCEWNKVAKANFSQWVEAAKNILIWDYPNCFMYELFNLPSLKFLRKTYRFFADNHVMGVFNEYVHRAEDGACQFAELKTYLISKLMWNPYMSESEYKRHYKEFMDYYYGKASTKLMAYIALYEDSLNADIHYNYDLGKDDKSMLNENLIPVGYRENFLRQSEELWTSALSLVTGEEKERVEREYTQFLYLKQILTFNFVMNNGTEEEKIKALQINRELIDLIKKYNIKLTFWGQSIEMQNAEIDRYATVSPIEWNYKW